MSSNPSYPPTLTDLWAFRLLLAVSVLILGSCTTMTRPSPPTLEPAPQLPAEGSESKSRHPSLTREDSIPEKNFWSPKDPFALPEVLRDDMGRASLIRAVQNQLGVMAKVDPSREVRLGGLSLTHGRLKETLEAFLSLLKENLSPEEFSRRIRAGFRIYQAGAGPNREMLFTGYYTPIIPASRKRTGEYIYPLYRRPPGLSGVTLVKNPPDQFTREEIDRRGALRHRGLEIAWLKDDVERFFLHIQGSGVLRFTDGTTALVGYGGSNGHPYTTIGRLMIEDNVMATSGMSMQGIKHYLREHPEDIPKYFFQNKRYIFFSLREGGPQGSGGAELVGGRSIATDKSVYPAGGLAIIRTRKPVLNQRGEIERWETFSRFVVDQDTGSAIRGPGRADLFFGIGERAGIMAGHLKEPGRIYYLLKKTAP